jgi:hypothetical protein
LLGILKGDFGGLEGHYHLRVRVGDLGRCCHQHCAVGDWRVKNTRRVKHDKVRTGGARTQHGIPEDFKAQVAYWTGYYDFLDAMSEDVRFVWLYGDLEDEGA